MIKYTGLAICIICLISCNASSSSESTVTLPDPFLFESGARMTSVDEWPARRAEIAVLAQQYELGEKPAAPEAVAGIFSQVTANDVTASKITVTVANDGKTGSFDCNITYPASGTSPYPAVIGLGYSNLNNAQLLGLGVAVITFPNDDVANQNSASSRGQGLFYDFYGSDHSAGALIAWAWGVSRLIDALETTPSAGIDAAHLAITGCSRNGKGALIIGAFDERIALTIPQESGAGGAASWRVSQWQKNKGQNVQTLRQIVTENCWFRESFSSYGSAVDDLPFDHHMIEALCAPRGLLVIENTSMEWLGNRSTWVNSNTAHLVWEALGAGERMGYSQIGHGDHCGLPQSQEPDVEKFVRRFLLSDVTADTNIMRTDGRYGYDAADWTDWTVPVLE